MQMQIENKIATIENVIDMLSGMIGPDKSPSPQPPPAPPVKLAPIATAVAVVDKRPKRQDEEETARDDDVDEHEDDDDDDDSSPERLKTKALQSLKRKQSERVVVESSVAEPSAPGT